jgi:hypothetical protein
MEYYIFYIFMGLLTTLLIRVLGKRKQSLSYFILQIALWPLYAVICLMFLVDDIEL